MNGSRTEDSGELLVRAKNMIAALQWAGTTYEGPYSDVTPGEGLVENLCPVCGSELCYGHAENCELWTLLKDLSAATGTEASAEKTSIG